MESGRPAGRAAGPAFIHADIAVSSPAEVNVMAMSAGKREMDNLQRLLALAKAEDLGGGDVTGELLPADLSAEARFVARQELVFCGGMMLCAIAGAYDFAW